MSTLYKQERLNNNFNLIVVSSYITEKYNYPKGMSAYFLGKTLLENYIQVLKKEIVHTKVKFKIVKPKIFNSPVKPINNQINIKIYKAIGKSYLCPLLSKSNIKQ